MKMKSSCSSEIQQLFLQDQLHLAQLAGKQPNLKCLTLVLQQCPSFFHPIRLVEEGSFESLSLNHTNQLEDTFRCILIKENTLDNRVYLLYLITCHNLFLSSVLLLKYTHACTPRKLRRAISVCLFRRKTHSQ